MFGVNIALVSWLNKNAKELNETKEKLLKLTNFYP